MIESFLADFFEVDRDKTKSSFLNGMLELSNLKAKKNIFQLLGIGNFELTNGFIGKLKIKLVLPLFYNNPISIEIDEVFVLIRHKNGKDMDTEDEINILENNKWQRLKTNEKLHIGINNSSSKENNILNKILRMINLEIRRIVIRLEDPISSPISDYILGIAFEEIKIKNPKQNNADIYKKITIKGVSAFIDIVKITINPSENAIETNFNKAEFDFNSFCRNELRTKTKDELSHQYLIFNLTTKGIVSYSTNQLELKSSVDINDFNLDVNLNQIQALLRIYSHEMISMVSKVDLINAFYSDALTLEEENKYVDMYMMYFASKYKLKEKASEVKNKLKLIEKGISYNTLRQLRGKSYLLFELNDKIVDIDKKMEEIQNKWQAFSLYGLNEDEEKLISLQEQRERAIMEQEKMRNMTIKEIIGRKLAEQPLPDKSIDCLFTFNINTLCVTLMDEGGRMIDLSLFGFKTNFSINNLSPLNVLIRGITSNQYQKRHIPMRIIETLSCGRTTEDVVLELNYEHRYDEETKGMKSFLDILNNRQIIVYLNTSFIEHTIKSIIQMFAELGNMIQIDNHKGEKVQPPLTNQTDISNKLENINLNIILSSPIVVIPIDLLPSLNSACLVFSFGVFTAKSNLIINNTPQHTYSASISNATLASISNWKDSSSISKCKPIINDIDINIQLTSKTNLNENINLNIGFNTIRLNITQKQIMLLLGLIDNINSIKKTFEHFIPLLLTSSENEEIKILPKTKEARGLVFCLIKRIEINFVEEKGEELSPQFNFVLTNLDLRTRLMPNEDIYSNLRISGVYLTDSNEDTIINPEFQQILCSVDPKSEMEYIDVYKSGLFGCSDLPSVLEIFFKRTKAKNSSKVSIRLAHLMLSVNMITIHRVFVYANSFFNFISTTKEGDVINGTGEIVSFERKSVFRKIINKLKERKEKTTENFPLEQLGLDNFPSGEEYHTNSKTKIKFSFDLKEIEINLPIDPTSDTTKVLNLNLNLKTKMNFFEEKLMYYTKGENKFISENYLHRNSNFNVLLSRADFKILNYNDNTYEGTLYSSNILSNTRITVTGKRFLLLDKRTSVANIDIHVEPISINIGMKQMKILLDYVIKTNQFKDHLIQNFTFPDVKLQTQEEKCSNVSMFNNLTDLNFLLEKLTVKLIDNIDGSKPVVRLDIGRLATHFVANTKPEEMNNISNALVEIITGRDVLMSQYSLYDMHLYFNSSLSLEIMYHNHKLNEWEPLLEPYTIEMRIAQITDLTRVKVDITSDVMFNVNLSYSMVQTLSEALLKMNQINDDEIKSMNTLDEVANVHWHNENLPLVTLQMSNILVEVMNKTGVDIDFIFDADRTKVIKLLDGNNKFYTQHFFNQMYLEASHTKDVHLIKKDKISIRILGSNFHSVDFSYNHITNFRLSLPEKKNNHLDFIELSVNVQTISSTIQISIEPNVLIYNNTDYKINLSFFNQLEDNIFHHRNITLENNGGTFPTPLPYMLKNYKVSGGLQLVDNHSQEKKIFYDNLNFTSQILDDYTHLSEAKHSHVVSFDLPGNKTINLSLDLIIMYSTSDLKTLRYEKNNRLYLNSESMRTYYYILVINPALIVRNKTPYAIKLDNGRNMANPINDVSRIDPNAEINVYDIGIHHTSNIKMSLLYYKEFESNWFGFVDQIKNEMNTIKLHTAEDEELLEMTGKLEHIHDNNNVISKTRFLKLDKIFSKSRRLVLFFDHIIINRTNMRLYVKGTGDKDNTKNKQVWEPHSLNLLHSSSGKIKLRNDNSEWTEEFKISTIGIEGVVELKTRQQSQSSSNDIFYLSVKITSSDVYTYSNVVVIQPRFVLVNKLGIPLSYKEVKTDDIFTLKPDEEQLPTFSKLNQIQFKFTDSLVWSSPVSLDLIEDVQIKLVSNTLIDPMLSPELKQFCFYSNEGQMDVIVRVVIHSQDNSLIYVIITPPQFEEMVIQNKSNTQLLCHQIGNDEEIKINPNTKVPFIWTDLTQEKKLQFQFNEEHTEISFDDIHQDTSIQLEDKQFLYFTISLENNNLTKVLTISNEETKQKNFFTQIFLKRRLSKSLRVNINLKGIGVSVIDDIPCELFYLSASGIHIKITSSLLRSRQGIEILQNYEGYVQHFQLDNCVDENFKLIIHPDEQIISIQDSPSPFIGVLITRKMSYNFNKDTYYVKYHQIDLILQEFSVKIDQNTINSVAYLWTIYNPMLIKSKVDLGIIEEQFDVSIASSDEVLRLLDAKGQERTLIEYLMISALKINLTLRIDFASLHVEAVPDYLVKIFGVIGNALARVTNLPLRFNEIVLHTSFIRSDKLIRLLQKFYTRQVLQEMYKIVGSSDLIGNPIGLVNQIGSGFASFFNEPRKRFVHGPSRFGENISSALNSLFANVIGGGFDTISKITGTLLTMTKNIQGESPNLNKQEPHDIIDDAYDAMKGGVNELGKGLTGIVTKPYQNAKREGVTGFFKGMGMGIVGAIISPFSAALTIGNSLAVGIKNNMTQIAAREGRKSDRVRYPRVITRNQPLKAYDETTAQIHAMLRVQDVDLTDNKLIYFKDFRYLVPGFDKSLSTLILTDKRILVLFRTREIALSIELKDIRNVELHMVEKAYLLVFFLRNDDTKYIRTDDLEMMTTVNSIFECLSK